MALSKIADFAVDCIPLVGTGRQTIKCYQGFRDGDIDKLVENLFGAGVGLFFDCMGGSVFTAAFKQASLTVVFREITEESGKKVIKEIIEKSVVKEGAVNIAQRALATVGVKLACAGPIDLQDPSAQSESEAGPRRRRRNKGQNRGQPYRKKKTGFAFKVSGEFNVI